MKNYYTIFSKCIFRTPAYNFHHRNKLQESQGDDFKEALYLASQDLYKELYTSPLPKEKTKHSLYKYAYRACSRSTPFGLFAGCSTANISENTKITLTDIEAHRRVTRLDMNYICALIQRIETQKEIRTQLKYYINDSIYKLAGAFRYVEYRYSGIRRVHDISKVEFNEYLEEILTFVGTGKHYNELLNYITDEDTSKEEAQEYLETLIDMQLLKSDLEPAVTGEDALSVLIDKLLKLDSVDIFITPLVKVNNLLGKINTQPIGTTLPLYEEIASELKKLEVAYDSKYLFQADVFKPTHHAEVSEKVIDTMCSAITFLNKITPRSSKSNLSEFIQKFQERYEEQQIPLLEVLDTELGIGSLYTGSTDGNQLLKDVRFGSRQSQSNTMEVSSLTGFMFKKYVECIKSKSNIITLSDDDLKKVSTDIWKDTPVTLSTMCSIVKNDSQEPLIYLKSVGDCCAANLLGRFCHLDNEILSVTKEITETEKKFYKDAIVAEIVYLPEARTGNILFRPVLRDYEIHYLAHPSVEDEFRIPVSDLYVSIRGNEVVVFSKKLNKQIIPRLTTAHNYSNAGSPVYQFLCDLQYQSIVGGFGFSWSSPFESLDYRPRVVYGNTILSRQQWKITIEDFEEDERKDLKKFAEKLSKICTERTIDQYGIISEGDNELLIDFDNTTAIEVFHSYLTKRKALWIDESLFDTEHPAVTDKENNPFYNEFLFLFHKNSEL